MQWKFALIFFGRDRDGDYWRAHWGHEDTVLLGSDAAVPI